MHAPTERRILRFGPFELDPDRRRLTTGGTLVRLRDRQIDVLLLLAAHAGQIVLKDTIIDAAWAGLAVTDNSIVQVVKGLRQTLGCQPDGTPYIETLPRQGYRFTAPVERMTAPAMSIPPDSLRSTIPPDSLRSPAMLGAEVAVLSAASITSLLDPYRAFVDGRAALETLDRGRLARASQAFDEALSLENGFAAAHVGMANACLLRFESTRADTEPDRAALVAAEHHAREGCRLDPESADAWSTLACVLHRSAHLIEGPEGAHLAVAAARKAVVLDPDEWRHHLRLAFVSWGGERLRAANRVLSLCPGLALAHWFAATVFVAREAFDRALVHARAGCALQDKNDSRFAAVGLHLLHGLLLAANGGTDAAGDLDGAHSAFQRELAFEDSGHIYARESAANTWYAIGALHLRQGHRDLASAAFQEALFRVPAHPLASIGLSAPSGRGAGNIIDTAVAAAVQQAMQGDHDTAARLCLDALEESDAGQSGWNIPIEPLLHVSAHPDAWADVLAALRSRAS